MLKEELISKMKNSESIQELNTYLVEFLNTVDKPEEWSECDREDHIYSLSDSMKLFEIKKYRLYNWWSDELLQIGIPVFLSDYPKLEKLVNELKVLNKESSIIHKKFNTHSKAELKRIKNESTEFQTIKTEHDDILEQFKLLEEKRNLIQARYTKWVDNIVNQIEREYGFINPNNRISEINEKLK